ncbi:MAG: MarR family transcriptional regulator [Anaerolineaceae bacterium]|nr:MarR family transcriptional regulator [Anaerolineaceae bacterium]
MSDSTPFSEILNEWTEIFFRRSFHDVKRFMDKEGLSPTQVNTLMRLHHCGESGVTELGEFTGVTNAAASQMIDRLVQMELIQRVESTSDRRYKQLSLTEKGEQLLQRGFESRRLWLNELTVSLEPDEQMAIATGLKILTAAAKKTEIPSAFPKKSKC